MPIILKVHSTCGMIMLLALLLVIVIVMRLATYQACERLVAILTLHGSEQAPLRHAQRAHSA